MSTTMHRILAVTGVLIAAAYIALAFLFGGEEPASCGVGTTLEDCWP